MVAKEGIKDLGFLVGKYFGVNAINPGYSKILSHLPSLYHALLKTCQVVKAENSRSDMLVYSTAPASTLFCHLTSFGVNHPNHYRDDGAVPLMGMIGIIQEFTGSQWRPKEIGLMSYQSPSNQVRDYLPNCQFLNGRLMVLSA